MQGDLWAFSQGPETRFITISTHLSRTQISLGTDFAKLITMPDPDISTFYLTMWQLYQSPCSAKPEEEAWAERMWICIDNAMTEKTMMVVLRWLEPTAHSRSDFDDSRTRNFRE
jgi:hypothetical protein